MQECESRLVAHKENIWALYDNLGQQRGEHLFQASMRDLKSAGEVAEPLVVQFVVVATQNEF